ncbi:alanine racemase [Streptococcus infantis]|uniref:alanine racemase n=1 Tax=Streptococcus infantis TaxID=68892 RepID=UPI0039C0CDC4
MKTSPHRPTKALINLGAIRYNIQQMGAHIPEGTLKWAVVKANAYGHGAIAVATAIQDDVDGFCVSNIDEAIELRQAGISKKILILGISEVESIALAQEFDITLTVAGLEWLESLLATESDLAGLTVHLKIDSGMGRIGFRSASEAQQAQASLKKQGANVEGIFTHFATADEESDSYFKQQLDCFKGILDDLQEVPEIVHASNSATTLWHAETIFNAVRMGDAMYGLNPSGQVLDLPYELKPALTLESAIVHVKTVETGACMGYGATYQADSEQVIATLPIGYADGWTRDMQNFSVLVDGQLCPIVGRVSMDQITIRLPKLYPLGTKVTLIGSDGDKELTATDVAAYRGTINYEVVCLLSDRIPREYY